MSRKAISVGWQLRAYLLVRPLLQPLMRRAVVSRMKRGKDDPLRSGEKLGQTQAARPDGVLIWLHAVGLGEVLALRPLVTEMARQRPDAHFLVTSTARSSAKVMAANLPQNTVHQFLPLDGPTFVGRFLDHWQPDVSIWSEQDLWPGAIYEAATRGVPLAYINARLSHDGFVRRARFRSGFAALMGLFQRIYAQDDKTVQRLTALGAASPALMGSLKPAAAPLSVDDAELSRLRSALEGRRVWLAASTHAGDEGLILQAHQKVLERDPEALLILVPRVPERAGEVSKAATDLGLSHAVRSRVPVPGLDLALYIADSFGELGLWYRLARVAFVGGSFADIGGHNPWEAVCLECQVLHGPNTANFEKDYRDLDALGLAIPVEMGQGAAAFIADVITCTSRDAEALAVTELVAQAQARLKPLAADLLSLIKTAS